MERQRYYRKVIRIKAEDSPNVQLALEQQRQGIEPTGEIVIPGVLPYLEYRKRRKLWDKVRQCVGLDAEFWEGAEVLLFPPLWLNESALHARVLHDKLRKREAKAIGIDPAEGGDSTALVAVDEYGVIDVLSMKTPNTAVIKGQVIAFGKKYGAPPENWVFDRGGGGKQISDSLKEDGYPCRSVGFGETVTPEIKTSMSTVEEREEVREERYAYKNRRAQLYGELSHLLDPDLNESIFCIPPQFVELRRQLAPIPKWYDKEGRLFLPPKKGKPGEVTMESLIGCSPDEADALVLAVHGLLHNQQGAVGGAL